MKKVQKQKGITLIALIITIVVLIILSSVGIYLTLGNDGIFDNSKLARDKYLKSANEESQSLEEIYSQLMLADSEGNSLENVNMTTLKSLIQQEVQKAIPTGTIIAYSVDNVPEGYLKCEGQAISRTDYSNLFNIIGTTYGNGDGTTTFNVPDLRGEFLRGSGINSHINENLGIAEGSGTNVGEHQDATIERGFAINSVGAGWIRVGSRLDISGNTSAINADTSKKSGAWDVILTPSWDESGNKAENYTSRPTNTSVLYCIKY